MDANQIRKTGWSNEAFRARTFVRQRSSIAFLLILILSAGLRIAQAKTVAQWLFDEQQGLYPSCVLGDSATDRCPLVLGMGARSLLENTATRWSRSSNLNSRCPGPPVLPDSSTGPRSLSVVKRPPWIGQTQTSARL